MIVGAMILLAVLAWVVYATSQPAIPNTGAPTTSTETLDQSSSQSIIDGTGGDILIPTSSDDLIDPPGSDHTEDSGIE